MSIVLGIDTSSTDLSIGLVRDDRPVSSFCRYIGNSHAEQISSAVSAILDSGGILPEHIDAIAAAVGPGSFTGLRIGLAFIKGFCIGRDIRVLPVSSLSVLVRAAPVRNGRVSAVIDARNDSVYCAPFDIADGTVCRRGDDAVVPAGRFLETLDRNTHVVIDTLGWEKSTLLPELRNRCAVWPIEHFPLQRGLQCALEAANTPDDDPGWTDAAGIHPNYIRRSMPEERRQREMPS